MIHDVQHHTCGLQLGEDAVQQVQLARGLDQLQGVTRHVAGLQEEVWVVAGLAQVHGSVLQAAHGLVIPPDAPLHPRWTTPVSAKLKREGGNRRFGEEEEGGGRGGQVAGKMRCRQSSQHSAV